MAILASRVTRPLALGCTGQKPLPRSYPDPGDLIEDRSSRLREFVNAMLRGWTSGLLLSAFSVALTLVAIEVGLRVVSLDTTPYRSTVIRGLPESRLAEPDFRLRGAPETPAAGTFRILVVGDSFSWGHGVHPEDTYARRLENRLNAVSRGEQFEVINWSRAGWNTLHEKRSLEGNLGALSPDLLILGFVLNDAEPEDLDTLGQLRVDLVRKEPSPGASSLLYRHSRLYALVWNRLENTRLRRAFNAYYHGLFSGPHWDTCRRALRRIRAMTRNREIPMLLLVFPIFDSQLDDSYAYRDLHTRMAEVGESLKLPVLDLLPVYEGIDARRLAVVPFTDAHPNELAHRIAADAILDYLVRGQLIPRVDHRPGRAEAAAFR
jgi:hypothetical protein